MIPDDFPKFIVPGHETEMDLLRQLMWLHYQPPAGPLATLWDEWLTGPTLWPALEKDNALETIREKWKRALSDRIIDPDGYVATHQHQSIAHQLGWPFPFWAQGGSKTWGWHFSLQGVLQGWHGTEEKTQEGWTLANAADDGIHDAAWHLTLTAPGASVTTPPLLIDVLQSPFLQLRWKATGLGDAQPFIEWTTNDDPRFTVDKRMYFPPIESNPFVFTMVPMFEHPKWQGEITRLRIHFDNRTAGPVVGIQALFAQYDTRHNINNGNFAAGCANYFFWTRDVNFLRDNINRIRTAIRYVMTTFKTLEEDVVVTPYVGHCGRSGIRRGPEGVKTILPGLGIGNNYWDLLPMGYKDAYATMHFYDALKHMSAIERAVAAHPEWDIRGGVLALDPGSLERHAADIKRKGNKIFWNRKTKRFNCALDIDGNAYDYGFTFLNLEAIYYDFATPEHAEAIMKWICAERIVPGDTSQGEDIYHWRFGPRATTRRNIEYYIWSWSNPEKIPWGGQVQDGGAVLGFSYHDLMARLKMRGPDNVARRLSEIMAWFDEVTKAGGYRAYYDGAREGKLQGGGTAGGLGLDQEFFESLLAPQIVLDGFLGFKPTADGFSLNPCIPSTWSELFVTRIHIHDVVLSVQATKESICITIEDLRSTDREPCIVQFPQGIWRLSHGPAAEVQPVSDNAFSIQPSKGTRIRFEQMPS